MKITVVGMGYVGLSNAILLAQNNQVVALEIDKEKVDLINNGKSTIQDTEIERFLAERKLNMYATGNSEEAYISAEIIVICTPTDYDESIGYFDTSSIETVYEELVKYNSEATVIIRSTVPIGYIESLREKYDTDRIIFIPEFLREGRALYDNLNPSRLIVGAHENQRAQAEMLGTLFTEGAVKKDIPIIYATPTEAESIKLFSNTYLALRVSFFNELDSFTEMNGLSAETIIYGMGFDPRIGNYYNNPSFGYGGYCLTKDTKQLLKNYSGIPNDIIGAIVNSNATRKMFVADRIMRSNPKTVGIYRLTMKAGSDNFRNSAIYDIIKQMESNNIEIIVYEPTVNDDVYEGLKIMNDFESFKENSDVIVANRYSGDLSDVLDKVYTRDIFMRD